MAYAGYDAGGQIGAGGDSTLVTSSIAGGNTVVIMFQGRNLNTPPFTHASGLTGVTLIAGPNDTGFGDDGSCFVYEATKNGTGALTLTPSQTSNSWWRGIVVDCETDTVVDQGMIDEGLFDTTISYTSPTMPAGGGTGLGMVIQARGASGEAITLTAPTWTGLDVEEATDGSFRVSISYGTITIAASSTSTMTGTISASTSHYDAWVLLQGGGPAFVAPEPLIVPQHIKRGYW